MRLFFLLKKNKIYQKMQEEIIEFQPDVRSFGAVQRKEIVLHNGYVFVFSDVFDFDTPPFICVDVYDNRRIPCQYVCVIDGGWLKSLTWTFNSVTVISNTGKVSRLYIDEEFVLHKDNT